MSMELEEYRKKELDKLISSFFFKGTGEIGKILHPIKEDVEGALGRSEHDINMKFYELAIDCMETLTKNMEERMRSFPQRHKDNLAKCVACRDSAWMEKFLVVQGLLGRGCLFSLIGSRGTGKTQMATALARSVVETCAIGNSARTVHYTVQSDMLAALKATYKQNNLESESTFMNAMRRHSLLVIDEINEGIGAVWPRQILTNLIDSRYMAKLDTIFISNLSWNELEKVLGLSIVDRMHEPDTGTIVEFVWPSFRRPPQ